MASCSDPTYDPGPVSALDLGGFDGTLEPPFATPLAQSFADTMSPFLPILDGAYTALEAESVLDIGSDVAGAIGTIPTSGSGGVNKEANDALLLAQSGFEGTRASVAELKSWLPPDVLAAPFTTISRFQVVDAGGAPIAGATVTIDVNVGAGSTLATGSDGWTPYFTVPTVSIVGYDVSAPGHAPATGVFNTYTDREIRVTLA